MAQFNDFGDPELSRMFAAAQTFAASVNYTMPYCLTLSGKTGTGKTHLARKVMRQFDEQNSFDVKFDATRNRIVGNTCMWVNWRKFCADARQGDANGMVREISEEWFVVIDDLGAGRDNTGFVTDLADQIISARVGCWTIITTNLPLEQLADQLDIRLADRLLRQGGVVVEVNSMSYAQRPKP